MFADCDLAGVKGLGTIRHKRRSFITVDTLARTLESLSGRFPDEHLQFFEGAGIPRTLLEYLPSILEAEPIQFFSCFISYADADQEFASRLDNELRDCGIRCWKYDVDALIGRGVWDNIDAAISLHEKAIVVCSRESLSRPGVLREIERALQREDSLRRDAAGNSNIDCDVLVPITLDDFIFAGWSHPRRADVLAKHVGTFKDWTSPRVLSESLKRLLVSLDPKSQLGVGQLQSTSRRRARNQRAMQVDGWGDLRVDRIKAKSPKTH